MSITSQTLETLALHNTGSVHMVINTIKRRGINNHWYFEQGYVLVGHRSCDDEVVIALACGWLPF